MRRFYRNRWWTCVLALCLGLAAPVFPISSARADDSPADVNDGSDPGGGPVSSGDPDMPQGPHNLRTSRGASRMSTGARTPGDGVTRFQGELRMRIQSVLLLLKIHYLRD